MYLISNNKINKIYRLSSVSVIWFCTFIVVIGITMVNMSHFDMSNIEPLIYGAIPVLIAAFCYPFGNQLVWEAKNGRKNLPEINPEVINNAFSKVFCLLLITLHESCSASAIWNSLEVHLFGLYFFSL